MDNTKLIQAYLDSSKLQTIDTYKKLKIQDNYEYLSFRQDNSDGKYHFQDWVVDCDSVNPEISFEFQDGTMYDSETFMVLGEYVPNTIDRMEEVSSSVYFFAGDSDYNYQDLLLDLVAIGFKLSPPAHTALYNTQLAFYDTEHKDFFDSFVD